jgi:hypothetical protein
MDVTRRSGTRLVALLGGAAAAIAAIVLVVAGPPSLLHPSAYRFERIADSDVRADWATLPVEATLGPEVHLPYHRLLPNLTDETESELRAALGTFDVRWHESSYHGRPACFSETRVCDPAACGGSAELAFEVTPCIYCRPHALRHDPAADVWIVSTSCGSSTENLAVAFRRLAR